MSFTSDSWKKTGGINRTSRHNLVRIPKAIEGSLKIYENTNSSNITIDGNSCLRIDQGQKMHGSWGTKYGTYRIGEDVSSNIYDPRELIFMNTDPITKNDYAYFMSESANGNTDRGNLTLVVGDNSDAHDDKFIIRGFDLGDPTIEGPINTDIAYFSSQNGAVFNKVGIGLSAPRSEAILDISGIAYGTDPVDNTTDISYNSQLTTIGWVNNYVTTIAAGNALWQSLDNSYDIYENVGNLALLLDGHTTEYVDDLYAAIDNPNESPKLYVDGTAFVTQNVGIGGNLSVGYDESYDYTTNASNALDISGNIVCYGGASFIGVNTALNRSTDSGVHLSKYLWSSGGIDGTAGNIQIVADNAYGGWIDFVDNSSGLSTDFQGRIRYGTTNGMTFYTNSNEQLRIDPNGNVGIGTNNPSNKLHIKVSEDNSSWNTYDPNYLGAYDTNDPPNYVGVNVTYQSQNGICFFSVGGTDLPPSTLYPPSGIPTQSWNDWTSGLPVSTPATAANYNATIVNYNRFTPLSVYGGDLPGGIRNMYMGILSSDDGGGTLSYVDWNNDGIPDNDGTTQYGSYNALGWATDGGGKSDPDIVMVLSNSGELRLNSTAYMKRGVAIGDGYKNCIPYTTTDYSQGVGADAIKIPQNGLIVEGNVGIGTNIPQSKLDVNGGVAIGESYTGIDASNNNITAPIDGLIVQGNVGIGTDDPVSKLHVGVGIADIDITDSNAVTIIHPTNASLDNINDPKDMLYLGRGGTGNVTYGSLAIFKLCKYQQDEYLDNDYDPPQYNVSSHARLDIAVSDVTADSSSPTVMSLRGDGHVGIGTDDPNEALDVSGNIVVNNGKTGQNQGGQLIFDNTYDEPGTNKINLLDGSYGFGVDGSTLKYLSWSAHKFYSNNTYDGNNGTLIMTIDNGGNVEATSYTAISDVRHKENICDLDRALEKICSIRGVNFNLKDDDENNKHAGILAQEVHEIIPEAICKKNDDKWAANYNTFIGYLIESVKTLKSEIDEYKKEKEEQQSRIESLESKMEEQGRLIQQLMDKMN